ncbi:MAG: response regulator [Tannerella sp.]|jgi:DNA-binding response OmpR family regulator|nr:response regulator [Tannerella sp.]
MNKIKLLLVESDDHTVFLIKNSLKLIGPYEIHVAPNGKKGLEMYESLAPDIIVTAIDLPIVDGKEMVRIIREEDIHTFIIFTTSYSEPKDFVEGLNSGADAYIRKPFIAEELDAQIRALLKRISYCNKQNMIFEGDFNPIGYFPELRIACCIFHLNSQQVF